MAETFEVIGTIGIWILIFWVPFQIQRLNQTIDAQSKLIKSFESQSSYIGNVQETMSRLYDPKEIESIVAAKVELTINDHKKEQSENLKQSFNMFVQMYTKDISSLVKLATMFSWHISLSDLNNSLKEYVDEGGNTELADMIRASQEQYKNKYTEAILRALDNATKSET